MQQTAEQPVSRPDARALSWSLGTRFAFRFVCIYLALFHIDPLLDVLKGVQQVVYRAPLRALDGWFATHVFHLAPAVANGGWGGRTDTPLYYIHVLLLLMF